MPPAALFWGTEAIFICVQQVLNDTFRWKSFHVSISDRFGENVSKRV